MRVLQLRIKHFRGIKDLKIVPRGHVVLVGEPGAGKSTVIEALHRALDADGLRRRLPDETDFYALDTSQPVLVVVTLGDLSRDLRQAFLDRLEVWDETQGATLPELDAAGELDADDRAFCLRLTYMIVWDEPAERAREELFFRELYTILP